jgi:alpha-beta hydrolase superfamily lysophospholipase
VLAWLAGASGLLLATWLGAGSPATVLAGDGDADVVPDLAREARLRAEIEPVIFDGEPLTIPRPGGPGFFAIFTEATTGNAQGTVMILHGRGLHADWHNLVQPLRVGLPAHGWNTLSIQLPVLAKSREYLAYVQVFPDAARRIDAAIDWLNERAEGPLILLAHSCGAHMANHWLLHADENGLEAVDGLVSIGLGATDRGQAMQEPLALDRVRGPVLDLFGYWDYYAVLALADARREQLAAARHPHSAQVVVPDAEHDFVGYGDRLTEVVADWLEQFTPADGARP